MLGLMGRILDPYTRASPRGREERQREEAEVEEHPPAPGGHVQEEVHERQQVVVVIRHLAQGAAQLLELWGEQALGGL